MTVVTSPPTQQEIVILGLFGGKRVLAHAIGVTSC